MPVSLSVKIYPFSSESFAVFGENYVDANLIMGLDKMFPKRIKLLSGDKPVISYAIKGEYKKILNIVNNLLSTIKELQSAEKDSIIKS